MSKPKNYAVTLPSDARPGLMRCGDLAPGKAYEFPAPEAVRLVDAKGFRFASQADEKAARAELKPSTPQKED